MANKRQRKKRTKRLGPHATGRLVWGLLDTKGNVWLGDQEAPWSYGDKDLAMAAHTLHCTALGWSGKRVKVLPLPPNITRKRDEIPAKIHFDQPGEFVRRYEAGLL
jgi:hypothetical protein